VSLCLAAPLQPASAQEKADETIVAKVNGKPITESDMRLAENELGDELGNLPPEIKRRALAEYLVDNMLFAEAAEAANIASSPQFEEQMNYLRRRVLREQYFEQTLKGAISADEAKQIYDTKVATLEPQEEFSARHILVESEEKAKELRGKIAGGADFAEVAKENSTDTGSKEQGGSLGYFVKGQMVPEFEAAVVKLQKGEVSEPVKTNFGWHVIKLDDRRRKDPPSFDSVKSTIMNSLVVKKAQEKVGSMREKAQLEYVDADIKKQVEEQANKQAEAAKNAAEQKAAKPEAPTDPKPNP
jgi:peptidyl-prolyl cis-trans isomerase C